MRGWVLSALERSGGADHVVFQELVKKNMCSGQRVAESHTKVIWVDVCRTHGHLCKDLGKEKYFGGKKQNV